MSSKAAKSKSAKKKTKPSQAAQDGPHRRQGGSRASNPLLAKWTTPFEMPPFDR